MRIFNFILKFRVLFILLSLVLGALSFNFIPNMQYDNSNESFFAESAPALNVLDNFKRNFGNDDLIFILLESNDKFSVQDIKEIENLVSDLEQKVPYVDKVNWLGNAESITGDKDFIEIAPVIDTINITDEDLKNILQKSTTDTAYKEKLISLDSKILGIIVSLKSYPGDGINERKEIPPVVTDILKNYPNLRTQVVGVPVLSYYQDTETERESGVWVMTSFIAMLLLLTIFTRSFAGIVIPLITVFLSIAITMGIIVILGFKVNMLLMMIPVLLLCVGIGDSMHLVSEFRFVFKEGMTKREALLKTISIIAKPITITSITTSLGFASFLFTNLVPLRELGLMAAIGTMIAYGLTFIFAMPALSFSRIKPNKSNTIADNTSQLKSQEQAITTIFDNKTKNPFLKIAYLTDKYSKSILVVFFAITLIMMSGLFKLNIDTAFIEELPKQDSLRQTFEYVDEKMGGSMSLEFVVKADEEQGIKNLSLLQDMDKFQEFLKTIPEITQTSSLIDQIKQVNRAIHEGNEDFYKLPDSQNALSENIFLYESGGGAEMERFVSLSYQNARIQARTSSISTSVLNDIKDKVNEFLKTQMPNRNITLTGSVALLSDTANYLYEGQFWSIISAFVTISLVMMLFLRSFKLGLISMIPNIIPAIFAIGLMGILGFRINMITVILAPIVLGVCIDDSVHFFTRYQQNFEKYRSYKEAYFRTFVSIGKILAYTTLVTAVGFCGFLLSKWESPRHFAEISIFIFVFALFCDLVIAPAFLKLMKPFGKEA